MCFTSNLQNVISLHVGLMKLIRRQVQARVWSYSVASRADRCEAGRLGRDFSGSGVVGLYEFSCPVSSCHILVLNISVSLSIT